MTAATIDRFGLEVERVDYCPKCQDSPTLRRLHGPVAGPYRDGWRCSRCGLDAVDLADAAAYIAGSRRTSNGTQWERLLKDCAQGRPVDPTDLARTMGRYFRHEAGPDRDGELFGLLCELSFGIGRAAFPDEAASPWRDEVALVVADMVLTALAAAGVAVVDALGPDAPTTTDAERDALHHALIDGMAEGVEYAAALGRWAAFGTDHPPRVGADVPAVVLAEIIDQFRDHPGRVGTSDADGARAMLAALHAAGYGLVIL